MPFSADTNCLKRKKGLTLNIMSIATTLIEETSSKRPQLAHLSAQLEALRIQGTYFKLRVLDDAQGA